MQPVRFLNDADNAALAELFERYAPALLTPLRLSVQSAEDAEDLLLEVFGAALEHDALRGLSLEEQGFWLWRVARNKLVSKWPVCRHCYRQPGDRRAARQAHTGAFVEHLATGIPEITNVTWSPDGQEVATGSSDNQVRVWQVATGAETPAHRGSRRDHDRHRSPDRLVAQ